MSGIFVVVPILAAAPVVLSATAAVAAAMGFSMVRQGAEELETLFRNQGETVVEFDLAEARGLENLLREQGGIQLDREDASLCFLPRKGRVQMLVRAKGRATSQDLEALGREVLDGITQQYAYHQVVSELKSRGFSKVEESREEDGTLRLRLRRWDG